ncbi:MAG: amidophosphoribosyltransferase [Candidatus Undinarchaeales archaeon]
MCGFIGIIGERPAAYELFTGMLTIQHRGQSSSGMLTFDHDEFFLKKKVGLVSEGFNKNNLKGMHGNIGIGHVRYPTIGSDPHRDSQPFTTYSPYGIGMAHNGNLVNYDEVKEWLYDNYQRRLRSKCDVEAIMKVFSVELFKQVHDKNFTPEKIFEAANNTMDVLNGGYSCVGLIAGKGLVGFRDPKGIRPMIFGKKELDGKTSYAFASETVALEVNGYEIIRDVKPGEVFFIDNDLNIHSKVVKNSGRKHCMFEWVYFARPDSVIEKEGVYEARLKLGRELAKKWKKKGKEVDVVIPVPDTSRTSALSFANEIDVPYREGLIKNRYSWRTFIMPTQEQRESAVRLKLNPVIKEIKGKKIALIDDSIVRGTTSKKLISLIRNAGAKEIHFLSACPPIKFPCYYAIDFADKNELIAGQKEIEEIRKKIGADTLTYQSIEGLKNALDRDNELCMACLNGEYPTEVTEKQKKNLSRSRNKERDKWKEEKKK